MYSLFKGVEHSQLYNFQSGLGYSCVYYVVK